ncbi:hypothetical protein [Rathayibacter sp. AY2B5]|uniref:hypothetical protein n=1 Tax=Rathayibacter sp. AY2B5 TaxID=2080570 RepID=UPI0011B0E37B|nr:hypothetical protein [Rathayibacter sp. AY2B5]
MRAEDLTAAATVGGVWVAGLVGIAGLVFGIVGLVQARRARTAAEDANRIAKDALRAAHDANSISRAANDISIGANQVSAEANAIAKAGEARATEVHDVTWGCSWVDPGRYRVPNEGRNTAVGVRVQIQVDEELVELEAPEVPGGGYLDLEFPGAHRAWRREEGEDERRRTSRVDGYPGIMVDPLARARHYIRDRVSWSTASGAPKRHDQEFGMAQLYSE